MEPPHSTGIDLSRRYYHELVWPLIASRWPDLPHAAGRLGQGSDVLGLDDVMSRDHDWGLRLTLLVDPEMIMPVRDHLDDHLPDTFLGHPTRFAYSGASEPIHHVDVWSPAGFAIDRLGIDPREGLTTPDWLALTGQTILEVTAGPIFTDTTGEISAIRRLLTWYPGDIWRYLVATAWVRLDEEMPLMSRAGFCGDDLGSRLIAARMVAVTVHLAFLIERRWAPYSKWRGTLFGTLACAPKLHPHLESALSNPTWQAGKRRSVPRSISSCVCSAGPDFPLPNQRPCHSGIARSDFPIPRSSRLFSTRSWIQSFAIFPVAVAASSSRPTTRTCSTTGPPAAA